MDLTPYAQLARIGISDDELSDLETEIEGILEYVEQIQEVSAEVTDKTADDFRNVMRDDTEPHETGKFTDALLREAPDSEDGYVRVKKIL